MYPEKWWFEIRLGMIIFRDLSGWLGVEMTEVRGLQMRRLWPAAFRGRLNPYRDPKPLELKPAAGSPYADLECLHVFNCLIRCLLVNMVQLMHKCNIHFYAIHSMLALFCMLVSAKCSQDTMKRLPKCSSYISLWRN